MLSYAARNHCFNVDEIFMTFKLSRVSFKGVCKDKKMKRERLVKKIFIRAVEAVVDDVIDNGTQFRLEFNGMGHGCIMLVRVCGDEFELGRKRGGYKEFDPLLTGFCGYEMRYLGRRNSDRDFVIDIHLDKERRERIGRLANEGRIKAGKLKDYTDYIDAVAAEFPMIEKKDIKTIMRFGFCGIQRFIKYGGDVIIHHRENDRKPFLFMTGVVVCNSQKMLRYVMQKMRVKVKVMYRRLLIQWDGWRWFNINKKRYAAIKDDVKAGKEVDYGVVKLYKFYDLAVLSSLGSCALFRIRSEDALDSDDGKYNIKKKRLVTSKAELDDEPIRFGFEHITKKKRKYVTLLGGESLRSVCRKNTNEINRKEMEKLRLKKKAKKN